MKIPDVGTELTETDMISYRQWCVNQMAEVGCGDKELIPLSAELYNYIIHGTVKEK